MHGTRPLLCMYTVHISEDYLQHQGAGTYRTVRATPWYQYEYCTTPSVRYSTIRQYAYAYATLHLQEYEYEQYDGPQIPIFPKNVLKGRARRRA